MRPFPGSLRHPLWDGFLEEDQAGSLTTEGQFLQGKRVLITGAGGYLGSALAEAAARLGAARLCLLDIAEYGLYRLQGHLQQRAFVGETEWIVGSVTDRALLREMIAWHRPHVVVHAAAMKHVPLMESNIMAAAAVNVLGTQHVFAEAERGGVECSLHISTDKAVTPASVMGTTKAIAEKIVLSSSPCARVVRLCNVLGSTGSVAPTFAEQMRRSMPLTVTHRDATRFFITRTQAVACLLDALQMKASLTVPSQAKCRRVEELAEYMLAGANSSVPEPRIVYIGLRPGERLHESLHTRKEESLEAVQGPHLNSLRPSLIPSEEIGRLVAIITDAVERRAYNRLRASLSPFYASPDEVPSWDNR